MRRILPSIWALMIYGCGLACPEPVQVAFAAQYPFAPKNIGAGAPLQVNFTEERAQPVVGYRMPWGPWGSPTRMGAITLAPPVEPIFRDSISKGLSQLGLDIATLHVNSADHRRIALQSLEYRMRTQPIKVLITAAARVVGYRHQAKIFAKVNRAAREEPQFLDARDGAWIKAEINHALPHLIAVILADLEILAALRSGTHSAMAEQTNADTAETPGSSLVAVEPEELAFFYDGKQIWLLEGHPLAADFKPINEIVKERFRPLHSDTTSFVVERYSGFADSQVRISTNFAEAAKPVGLTIATLADDSSLWSNPNNEKAAGFEYQKLEWRGGVEPSAPGHLIFYPVSCGVPKERVAYLRSGFARMARDRNFVAAREIKFFSPDAVPERIAKMPAGSTTTTQGGKIP